MELVTEIEVMKNEMKNLSEKVDSGFASNSAEHKEIVALFQEAMDKKAGKWVERVLISTGSIVGVAVIGALLAQILK